MGRSQQQHMFVNSPILTSNQLRLLPVGVPGEGDIVGRECPRHHYTAEQTQSADLVDVGRGRQPASVAPGTPSSLAICTNTPGMCHKPKKHNDEVEAKLPRL